MTGAGANRLDGAVLVMAGGTGGHVYPALAVAERLRDLGARVVWLGTARGLEARRVPQAGFELHHLRVSGLRGRGLLAWLAAPLALGTALVQALAVIARVRPRLALGFGGYASGPGGVASHLTRTPLVLHEQNTVPGLTNRVLGRFATRLLEAFPGSFPAPRGALHTGNPVREDLAAIDAPGMRLAGRSGPLQVLVVGGSQGARVLNEILPAALAALPAPVGIKVRHQTGAAELEATRERYRAGGVEAEACAFIEDMADAYAWADLVVCRAGAMTVCELAAAGVASVLVPYPHAVDDHQTRNARYLVDAGAALLVPQAELEPGRLGALLTELHGARRRVLEMAEAARRVAVPDATDRVVRACLEVAGA